MKSNTRYASAIIAILALCAASCVDPQEVTDINAKVDTVQVQQGDLVVGQRDLLSKLASLEAGQKRILRAVAAQSLSHADDECSGLK